MISILLLCHKWPGIGCTCRKYFPVLSSIMTYHRVCSQINTTGTTSEAGTATLPEYLSSTRFSGVRVTRYLVLCVVFCRSLFVRLCFFFWPLCCLSVFDLRIQITPLYLQTLLCSHFFVNVLFLKCGTSWVRSASVK